MRKLLAALLLLTACGGAKHIKEYEPKKRTYELDAEDAANTGATPGSLYSDRSASGFGSLFADPRALRKNDLVVIEIEEVADARRSASTDIERQSESSAEISEFLGLIRMLQEAQPDVVPALSGNSKTAFDARGATGRTERFLATVPAIVRKVLPNGNLFVEGHRVVLVNEEEQHFYISGVIRPIDITGDNTVKSSKVADAEIEFTGRGVLTDNQEQGWISRNLGWLWPF